MNQFNQVTIPLGCLMTALQAQRQLQPTSGSPTASFAGMPQTAVPSFYLQGLQPGSQIGGQSWGLPTLQTVQTVSVGQPLGFQSSATTKQPPAIDEVDGSTPIAFAPDDERVLVNALREAKGDGLSPLQGLSNLDKVNNHTAAAWKDYFIKHIERLGPMVYPQAFAKTSAAASPSSVVNTSRSSSASGGSGTSPALVRHRDTREGTTSSSKTAMREDGALEDTSALAGHRIKRRDPAAEEHDETCIPPLPPHSKPKPPCRQPGDDSPRFTKEDKIFFIHFLKYRLRKGPVPKKAQLCRELAEQTPHHSADSWKRHWDRACKLPNEIYIQARKRVESDIQETLPVPPNHSHAAQPSDEEDDSGDEDEADGEPAEPGDDLDYEPSTIPRTPFSTSKKHKECNEKPRRKHRPRIMEEELRRMARYIVDKRKSEPDSWECLAVYSRWEEFASRTQNTKRTLAAWVQINYRLAKKIDAYVQEYQTEHAPPSTGEKEASAHPHPPASDGTSSNASSETCVPKATEKAKSPSKRSLEVEQSGGGEPSTPKRARLVKQDTIVVSDSD